MINLLQVHPEQMHRAEPTPQARQIKVFADIIRRDKGSPGDAQGRYKQRACQELAWIYHMCDYESPYAQVPENQREAKVTEDIFAGQKWAPDDLVRKGLDLYRELATTPSMRLLDSAYAAMSELEGYFRGVDFDATTVDGRPKYVAKDVMGALEKMAKLVDGISELRKQVEKEKQTQGHTWGDIELNEFSR